MVILNILISSSQTTNCNFEIPRFLFSNAFLDIYNKTIKSFGPCNNVQLVHKCKMSTYFYLIATDRLSSTRNQWKNGIKIRNLFNPFIPRSPGLPKPETRFRVPDPQLTTSIPFLHPTRLFSQTVGTQLEVTFLRDRYIQLFNTVFSKKKYLPAAIYYDMMVF